MASLRARLVAGLLIVAAAGLLLLGGGPYAGDEHGPPPGGGGTSLPPGTYGQLRNPDGTVVPGRAGVVFGYASNIPPAPKLPAKLGSGDYRTVGAVSGGGRYRVYAAAAFAGGALTVVAVPLGDTEQTLHQLL